MKTLRVYNLTDIETEQLRQHCSVNITFAVGRLMLAPGDSGQTADDEMTRSHLAHYVAIGAASVDSMPAAYQVAKDKLMSQRRAEELREKAKEQVAKKGEKKDKGK